MPTDRPTDQEVERLRSVYRAYRESPAVQAQWDGNNPGNRAIVAERQRATRAVLNAAGYLPLKNHTVLEVGCGSGGVLPGMVGLGARPDRLYGVDLLPERIEGARQRYPGISYQCANAERLAFPDGHFDLVLLSTVFSSILDEEMAGNVAQETVRVLKPGGAVLWYDFHHNPKNPHVRGMTRARIGGLFPSLSMNLRSVTLVPPLARRMGPLTPVLYPLMASIPLLRTHYLGLLVKGP